MSYRPQSLPYFPLPHLRMLVLSQVASCGQSQLQWQLLAARACITTEKTASLCGSLSVGEENPAQKLLRTL